VWREWSAPLQPLLFQRLACSTPIWLRCKKSHAYSNFAT
jgi:hypothetical protein